MRYKIADLIVEIPEVGGLAARCRDYECKEELGVDFIIRTELYPKELYSTEVERDSVVYMKTGAEFAGNILNYDGFYIHSSAVALDGKAYLFSGPCGIGKSTHTRLWQKKFGEAACVINDDKPVLRRIDGTWYAYGTPWCGKDGINSNQKVPLAGVCFLKQAEKNKIRRLDSLEAMQRILPQTMYKFRNINKLDCLMGILDLFLKEIPVYELENIPEISAAQLSYETMFGGAKEAGL